MKRSASGSLTGAASALALMWGGACGPASDVDDITPGGPSSLSPALDPTYEGRDLDGWVAALGSRDAADRYAALLALAEFNEAAAVHRAAIEARLEDSSPSVRWAALETLGRMGDAATASARLAVARLDDDDEGVRRAAARAATRYAGAAVEALRARLLGDDSTHAEEAADVLVAIGAPAVDVLAGASADERALTSVTAITAIGRLGAVAGDVGTAALERAASRKGDVRTTALDALAALGGAGADALRRLAQSVDADLAAAAKSRLR